MQGHHPLFNGSTVWGARMSHGTPEGFSSLLTDGKTEARDIVIFPRHLLCASRSPEAAPSQSNTSSGQKRPDKTSDL